MCGHGRETHQPNPDWRRGLEGRSGPVVIAPRHLTTQRSWVQCNTQGGSYYNPCHTPGVRDGSGASLSEEPHYRGRRLGDLQVIDIGWPDWCVEHIGTRTRRYSDSEDELDIEPEWATEAALDEYRRLSLTRENDLRVTGWSENAPAAPWSQRHGRVLRVVLKPVDIEDGYWSGFTAAPASQKAAEWYWRKRGSFGAA